ncbi:MAG TPA: hypothetical protein GXX65_05490 [Methanosarcina sp.]|nr:hypothetical protein [Methanosarcina sp.]MDD4522566.1 hypothetical protein [Methanosarcina sp.]HHV23995.1 hypothetical protein [Methanosarcina sp.]
MARCGGLHRGPEPDHPTDLIKQDLKSIRFDRELTAGLVSHHNALGHLFVQGICFASLGKGLINSPL